MNALVIFVYPGVEIFLKSLIRSINRQTRQDFSVVFVNDGLAQIEDFVQELLVSSEILNVFGNPYENRVTGLKKIRNLDIENIIFQDADDLMAPNRIEECVMYLETDSVVVNDLDLINREGEILEQKYWSDRVNHGFEFDHKFITHYNLLGFTNTALKKELLNEWTDFDNENNEVIAADWFIFYQILFRSNTHVRFINSTTSLYRQHSQNVTGLGKLTETRLRQAIKVKRKHYQALISTGYPCTDELGRIKRLEGLTSFRFKQKFNSHLFWWEETEYVYEES